MKFLAIVALIAAVTINCFLKTVNGKPATDTLAAPYIDTLLPPFEDVQDSGKDASTKFHVTGKRTPASVTTATTKKPIKNDNSNILPELSIEALLPPLHEAKIEKAETETESTRARTTTTARTTKRPTTTTTRRAPATTRRVPATTRKYSTATSQKPSNLKVPELLLDSLVPPLFNSDNFNAGEGTTATTPKHLKTQVDNHYKISQAQNLKHLPAGSEVENDKKLATDKYVAETTQTHPKVVSLFARQQNVKSADTFATKNSNYDTRQYDYSFDWFFGPTTHRPHKSGLPTITPFPHRLGR